MLRIKYFYIRQYISETLAFHVQGGFQNIIPKKQKLHFPKTMYVTAIVENYDVF
jgi:hypothetical protein